VDRFKKKNWGGSGWKGKEKHGISANRVPGTEGEINPEERGKGVT